jgi:hypothetical protein
MIAFSSRPPASFFSAPQCGREILAGFSYLQRIRKGATTRAWLPPSLVGQHFEWAAVREFELLQEADNLALDELEVSDLKRSFQALYKMRAGGYRVVMVTMGRYTENNARDELEILDHKLQEEITRMIHFLYLGERSHIESALCTKALGEKGWSCLDALPHIKQNLAARCVFRPEKRKMEEDVFFHLLEKLPARHIVHEKAVGLALPDATKDKNWVYIAKGEHRVQAFFNALGDTMGEMIHHHMRGYGDRLTPDAALWQRRAAQLLI